MVVTVTVTVACWLPVLDWGTIVMPAGSALVVAELCADGVAIGALCAPIPCPILCAGEAEGAAGAPAWTIDSAGGRTAFWFDAGVSEIMSALAEEGDACAADEGVEDGRLDGKERTRPPPPATPVDEAASWLVSVGGEGGVLVVPATTWFTWSV